MVRRAEFLEALGKILQKLSCICIVYLGGSYVEHGAKRNILLFLHETSFKTQLYVLRNLKFGVLRVPPLQIPTQNCNERFPLPRFVHLFVHFIVTLNC
jgi:hypothetical protein